MYNKLKCVTLCYQEDSERHYIDSYLGNTKEPMRGAVHVAHTREENT